MFNPNLDLLNMLCLRIAQVVGVGLPFVPIGFALLKVAREVTKQDASLEDCIANLSGASLERRAAWSLYVELVSRIAVQPLETDQGLLREALTSLYNLFGVTRQVLKEAGPDVGTSRDSVGGIAITVLNNGLRPFLTKWHPLLQTWEAQRPPNLSPKEHEQKWVEEPNLRKELEALRSNLEQYALALAEIAGALENREY